MGLDHLGLPGGQVRSGAHGGCGWTDGARGEGPPAQGPSRSRSPAWVPVAGRWSAPGGWAKCLRTASGSAGPLLALADAGRMKGHSCYAICGAGAALGARAANSVRTATRQDGQRAGIRREASGASSPREFPVVSTSGSITSIWSCPMPGEAELWGSASVDARKRARELVCARCCSSSLRTASGSS